MKVNLSLSDTPLIFNLKATFFAELYTGLPNRPVEEDGLGKAPETRLSRFADFANGLSAECPRPAMSSVPTDHGGSLLTKANPVT